VGECESPFDSLATVAETRALEFAPVARQRLASYIDPQHVSRRYESLICYALDGFKQYKRDGKVLHLVDEPAGGLDHRFEHQHARQDGKIGEMFGQVLFGEGDAFLSHDPAAGVQLDDAVNQVELHGGP